MKNEKTNEWIEFKKTPYILKVHYRSLMILNQFSKLLSYLKDKEQNAILSRKSYIDWFNIKAEWKMYNSSLMRIAS